ncbi:MAG TPA: DUF6573 family protein [Nitrospira sp.]|nr:DUF6573 family protein [Nitrospira sp.]
MDEQPTARALSHDERHAAEAAFAGRPFNPRWSARARAVYDGILKSRPTPVIPEEPSVPTPLASGAAQPPESDPDSARAVPASIPFQQALDAGSLIDVTPTAKQLGLSFSVTVTKPLWETGIAPENTLTEVEQSARLRDVLMAFRLRLASQPTIAPLVDFPALLAFPHGAVPQPVPLFALIQPDEQNKAMVTLLLPTEVATTIIPLN